MTVQQMNGHTHEKELRRLPKIETAMWLALAPLAPPLCRHVLGDVSFIPNFHFMIQLACKSYYFQYFYTVYIDRDTLIFYSWHNLFFYSQE